MLRWPHGLRRHTRVARLPTTARSESESLLVCKPSVAHGSSDAHKMALIFNEDGVKDCRPPCVAQTFINHNAVLYKIYFVGDKYSLVERPSLKNFYPCNRETIFFDSHAVSKADSTSSLSVLDPEDVAEPVASPLLGDQSRFQSIVDSLRREFGMALLGVDVVVENGTGRYAIIDVNAYPSYDGFPNYFENLMNCILETIDSHSSNMKPLSLGELYDPFIKPSLGSRSSHTSPGSLDQDDSGFDTSDSSDEKKKHDMSLSGKADSFAIGKKSGAFRS
ncbi:unnamed protein product [Timema podura]|uniref:inositol-1,3,4-trisphosphate 5/6-kinase n=1 Tax=Timema podura TaxID=61482 RepID=A0ABN7NXW6_TIMPD|nr:unnamed protein product [Timema podura]